MKGLLVIRENLQKLYARYGGYISKIGKFLLALITFFTINKNLGYMEALTNPILVLVLSAACIFLPVGFTVFFGAVLVLAHLYKLSVEVLLICAVLMLILFLVYMRVVPKQSVVVLLVPLAFALKIPYVIPIALGLVSTPLAIVSTACGVFVYYMLHTIAGFGGTVAATGADGEALDMISRVTTLTRDLVINKEMFLFMIGFAIVILVVYIIRRLGFPFSWMAAIVIGLILQFAAFTILGGKLDVSVNGPELVMGSLVSLVVALILHLFFFTVDYSATKKLQFEDDEYVYYVKAIPKLRVSTQTRRVKHIREEDAAEDAVLPDDDGLSEYEERPDFTGGIFEEEPVKPAYDAYKPAEDYKPAEGLYKPAENLYKPAEDAYTPVEEAYDPAGGAFGYESAASAPAPAPEMPAGIDALYQTEQRPLEFGETLNGSYGNTEYYGQGSYASFYDADDYADFDLDEFDDYDG